MTTTIMIKSPSAYFVFIPGDEDEDIPPSWLNLSMIYEIRLLNQEPLKIEYFDCAGDSIEIEGKRAQAIIDALTKPAIEEVENLTVNM